MHILLEIQEGAWTLFFIGFSIVFIVLSFLVVVFSFTPYIIKAIRQAMNPTPKSGNSQVKPVTNTSGANENITSGESAAIAAALHFYFNQNHDEESNVITIKRIERRYTPWSSKIYGLRNLK